MKKIILMLVLLLTITTVVADQYVDIEATTDGNQTININGIAEDNQNIYINSTSGGDSAFYINGDDYDPEGWSKDKMRSGSWLASYIEDAVNQLLGFERFYKNEPAGRIATALITAFATRDEVNGMLQAKVDEDTAYRELLEEKLNISISNAELKERTGLVISKRTNRVVKSDEGYLCDVKVDKNNCFFVKSIPQVINITISEKEQCESNFGFKFINNTCKIQGNPDYYKNKYRR